MVNKKESEMPLKVAMRWLGYVGNLQTLWTIAVAFIVTVRKVTHMPGSWSVLRSSLFAGAWFFGTWAVLGTIVWTVDKALPKIKTLLHPHSAEIRVESGKIGALTLLHFGASARWTAQARIVKTLDGSPIANPMLFRCY